MRSLAPRHVGLVARRQRLLDRAEVQVAAHARSQVQHHVGGGRANAFGSPPGTTRGARAGAPVSGSRTWQWTMAAPASAACKALSAMAAGERGTWGLRSWVAPAPVTAQVMKTSLFMASGMVFSAEGSSANLNRIASAGNTRSEGHNEPTRTGGSRSRPRNRTGGFHRGRGALAPRETRLDPRQRKEAPSRSRAMMCRCTSLGPSPMRRMRISRYQRSKGKSLVTP